MIQLQMDKRTIGAVPKARQEMSEEGLGWSTLLQNESDTLSFAGVSARCTEVANTTAAQIACQATQGLRK